MHTSVPARIQAPSDRLRSARALLDRCETARGHSQNTDEQAISTPLDRPLALPAGCHEFFAAGHPPLVVLIDLAWRALEAGPTRSVVWIGRETWPYPHALLRREPGEPPDRRLLERSVFIDPATAGQRAWVADLALRCEAVAAVVCDGSGLTMPETRRLQLAARAGDTVGLFARPTAERRELSAAMTRWLTSPRASPSRDPEWTLELIRAKGVPTLTHGARTWAIRRDHNTAALDPQTRDGALDADLRDRSAQTA